MCPDLDVYLKISIGVCGIGNDSLTYVRIKWQTSFFPWEKASINPDRLTISACISGIRQVKIISKVFSRIAIIDKYGIESKVYQVIVQSNIIPIATVHTGVEVVVVIRVRCITSMIKNSKNIVGKDTRIAIKGTTNQNVVFNLEQIIV
ncbi:MAG: hypothetical protein Kow0027_17610 [Saprospiraceae bacterium]